MTFRAKEKVKIDNGAWFGDITSINLTQVQVKYFSVLL